MVIDTSAIIAVLLGEPESDAFMRAISNDARRAVSALSALECSIVIRAKKGPPGQRELDLIFHTAEIDIVAFDKDQYLIAKKAYEKYGKGIHPAGLNLGDCCSYALAISLGEPLLYKGGDFSKTDVATVRHDTF